MRIHIGRALSLLQSAHGYNEGDSQAAVGTNYQKTKPVVAGLYNIESAVIWLFFVAELVLIG